VTPKAGISFNMDMIEGSGRVSVPEDLYDQEFADALLEEVNKLLINGHTEIVLDFTRCQSISSYGLGQLLKCSQLAGEKGAKLSLNHVKTDIKDMLTALLFHDVLKIE